MKLTSAVCPIRVGRDAEVERLRRNAALSRTTFISGPAGVGKSRMSSEALAIGTESGRRSLVGHCTIDQSIAFEPFAGAVRRRTRTMDDTQLADLFSGGASLAAALIPDGARLTGASLETPPQEDLFAAIWTLLHRLAGGEGAVLLLEDLHWADADSLRLLTCLARESEDLGLWIVGTYRGDEVHRRHPLAPVLAELARERRFDEIILNPLSQDEVAEMVRAIFGGVTPGVEFVDSLYGRTQGNPFFTEELLKALLERGEISAESGELRQSHLSEIEMPTNVRETLLSRARSLSPGTSSILHLAALDGDRLDVAVLAAATQVEPSSIDEMISEALNLQLLAELHDAAGPYYVFRHALTREALSDEMVGPDRRQGHLRLAAGVLSAHADDLAAHAASLAEHFVLGGDRVQAIVWGRRAAQIAVASFAVDETSRRYEQVLALMAPDDPERLEVLLEAVSGTIDSTGGTAGSSTLKMGVGFASEARRLAQRMGDPVSEARAIEALSVVTAIEGSTSGSVELLREALSLVHGRDDFLESWILARLCGDLTRSDAVEEANELLPQAMEVAKSSENHLASSRLHVIAMMNESFGPSFAESLEAARREAKFANSSRAEHSLEQTAGFVSLWCGDFAASRRCFERSLAVGQRLSTHDGYTAAGYLWLMSLSGQYDDVGELLKRTRDDNALSTKIVELTGLYEIAERRGASDVADVLDELWRASMKAGESQRSVPALSAQARFQLINEGVLASSESFWAVLEATVSARGRGSHWLFSPDFAMGLFEGEQHGELIRWARAISEVTANDAHPHNRAADALVQGCNDMASGNWDEAAAYLANANSLYSEMGCPARVAETRLMMATMASRLGEAVEARRLATEAVEVAGSIGAAAIVERARAFLDRESAETAVVTIMFTDIVDSTQRARDVGDQAWRSLLERHDAVVRRELANHRGREVNTTGDGFVAAFDTASQAVRCAVAVRAGLAPLALSVRAGLHTGECQVVGDDLRGVAVHLAARVCASGVAGEVRVTSTVKEMVSGLGFAFNEIGEVQFKGFSDSWRIFDL